jgi:hypothetical protein
MLCTGNRHGSYRGPRACFDCSQLRESCSDGSCRGIATDNAGTLADNLVGQGERFHPGARAGTKDIDTT